MKYPAWIENYWLEQACTHWRVASVEAVIERARAVVARLSDLFTTDRPVVFPEYASNPDARLAYGLFFFPQTFARILWILDECFNQAGFCFPSRDAPLKGLDLGAGSGAATLAALTFLSPFNWRWRAVERSPAQLEDLRRLVEAGRSNLALFDLETRVGDLADSSVGNDTTWDLILLSFALNETIAQSPSLAHGILSRWLERLSPQGLLVICEPASQSSSECLETFRNEIIEKQLASIVGPCLHEKPCPLLAQRRFWCHEVRSWAPPPIVEMINRKLYRDLSHLKFCFLAVTKRPFLRQHEISAARARLVAPIVAERGKLVTRGCAEDGRVYTYEILTRHLSSESRAIAMRYERGTRVQFDDIELLRGDVIRARGIAPLL